MEPLFRDRGRLSRGAAAGSGAELPIDRRSAPRALLPALAALAACSSPAAGPPPEDLRLPNELSLPLGPNRDCGCVDGGACAVLEQRPGHSEVRSLSCAWVRAGTIARCRFESRFVEWGGIYRDEGRNVVLEPISDPWRAGEIRARRTADGSWCAL